MIKEVKPFKVKIKSGKWNYKNMVGQVVTVVNRTQSSPGRTIPVLFRGQEAYAFEKDGRTFYIDPADCDKNIKETDLNKHKEK